MKKILLSILALCAVVSVKAEDKVLLTVDGQPVMQSEFLYIYEKNNQETAIDQKSIDEYLDLFINFKLKVREAENQGIDTTEAFKKELASYRKQATPKYMMDEALEEDMIRLSYEHMKIDRRVAHIAVECPMGSDPETEAAALKAINDARIRVTTGMEKQVKKGKKMVTIPGEKEDFHAVALEVSTDPSVQENKGELGWIVPFRYVWPFEKAAYNTEVGQVSEVFRTQYGFHIALIEEERPHEEVHASHIMKMVPRGNDSLRLAKRMEIEMLYEMVKGGAPFADIARENSDDKGSAMKGGDLGWFGHGMMVKPFEDAAFALSEGELGKPFESRFGWHFIYLHERRTILPYEEMRDELRTKMKRDERYQEVKKAYADKLRKEYGEELSDAEVLAKEDANLENKHPELKSLMKEYHDGILLFEVSLKEVWDKASLDTVGITEFFKKHKKEYKWEQPRFKGYVVYAKNEIAAKAAKSVIKSAQKDSVGSYLDKRINNDSVRFVRTEHGVWQQGQSKAVDKLQWKKGDWTPGEDFPIVYLLGKTIKAPQEYTDERGKVVSAYQDYLEKEWITKLKAKYPVVVNEEALNELKAGK